MNDSVCHRAKRHRKGRDREAYTFAEACVCFFFVTNLGKLIDGTAADTGLCQVSLFKVIIKRY